MKTLCPIDLDFIMENDTYYALPYSISVWIHSLELKTSEQVIFERIISMILQGRKSKDRALSIRLSNSLISKVTNIKTRTVINTIQKLVDKNLIEKRGTNENGTLYSVNISSKSKELIKPRRKFEAKRDGSQEIKQSTIYRKHDPIEHKSPVENNNDEIKDVKNPLRNFLKKQSVTTTSNQNKETNIDEAKKFSSRNIKSGALNESENLLSNHPKQIKNKSTKNIVKNSNAKEIAGPKKLSGKDRLITHSRLRKMFNEKISKTLLNEITWAMQFGWYSRKKWSVFHCVNHAIRLLKDKTWTTPLGYEASENFAP